MKTPALILCTALACGTIMVCTGHQDAAEGLATLCIVFFFVFL